MNSYKTIHINRLRDALGVASTTCTRIDALRNGAQFFPAMLEAIENAEQTIEFETFIYWQGTIAQVFANALAAAARRGVCVRIILDSFGAQWMDRSLVQHMADAGTKIAWFRPLKPHKFWRYDHRTHRKILVCDRKVAFTGGAGIAEEWEGDAEDSSHWRDTHFRLEGEAAADVRSVFSASWLDAQKQIAPYVIDESADVVKGDIPVHVIRASACIGWNEVAIVQHTMIAGAAERLWIASAYFVPDSETHRLLLATAERGVDVRILLPGTHTDRRICRLAHEWNLAQYIEAGVQVHRFQPTMMHCKLILVDGLVSCFGSANLNHRSIAKDEEIAVAAIDPQLTATLETDFENDLSRSRLIRMDELRNRPLWRRAIGEMLHPFREEL